MAEVKVTFHCALTSWGGGRGRGQPLCLVGLWKSKCPRCFGITVTPGGGALYLRSTYWYAVIVFYG